MASFTLHTPDTAPAAAGAQLAGIEKAWKFIPSFGRLADALGIRFALSPEIKALYQKFGHDLPSHNGDGAWSLPMPATFVLARGGQIVLAEVDPDYRRRMEPATALATLGALVAEVV